MANVAIITARGGSKRIPGKNIKDFLGKPIITYSIQAAIESELFDEVMVSTDDDKIAEVALKFGAKVPFRRSELNSNDYATTAAVLKEVIEDYAREGREFQHACCVYPCAPLVNGEVLKRAYNKLVQSDLTCVIPILSFSYPIWRALKQNEAGDLSMIWPENLNTRSQDLPIAYHDAGQFYFFEINKFRETGNYMLGKVGGILLDDMEAQDIDNLSDWQLAELKYQLRTSQNSITP